MAACELQVDAGVATLVLNRPESRNAMNGEMFDLLVEAVHRVEVDDAIHVVVLRGAGDAFCAGGDVKAMDEQADANTPEARRVRFRGIHRTVKTLARLDKPVIAAVDGPAYGAGFGLALWADFVIATPQARFCMSFARIGLVPDFGSMYTLPRVVGVARARVLMLSAREVPAEEALALGIATEIVERGELHARAMAIAAALAQASPLAMRMTKQALNGSLASDLNTMLELEAANQGIAGASAYTRDAVHRFATREPARFRWPHA